MNIGSKILENTAGISVLKTKSHLDSHEPHAEVDDGAQSELRFFGGTGFAVSVWNGLCQGRSALG